MPKSMIILSFCGRRFSIFAAVEQEEAALVSRSNVKLQARPNISPRWHLHSLCLLFAGSWSIKSDHSRLSKKKPTCCWQRYQKGTEIFKIVGGVLLFAAPYSAGTLQDTVIHYSSTSEMKHGQERKIWKSIPAIPSGIKRLKTIILQNLIFIIPTRVRYTVFIPPQFIYSKDEDGCCWLWRLKSGEETLLVWDLLNGGVTRWRAAFWIKDGVKSLERGKGPKVRPANETWRSERRWK